MKNSKTPKIVVGVGLAAIYAAAMASFIPRGGDDSVAAQTAATTPAAQVASELAPPPAIDAALADTSASVAEQSTVTTAPPVPVASTAAKVSETSSARRETEAKSQVKEQPAASVASAAPSNEGGLEEPRPAIKSNSAGDNTVITEDVSSPPAAVASEANSDVITNGPVVELDRAESTQE